MDLIVERIKKVIEESQIETSENIIYQIKHKDPEAKQELKKLLPQGDDTRDHSIIEIDFVKEKPKISRFKKLQIKKNICSAVEGVCFRGLNEEDPDIRIYNSSIFIYGEYIKKSREMTQTPLNIDGDLKTEKSVSDFIFEFKRFYDADEVKFMSCGREDIDVRCLEGRPFLLEIVSPKCNILSKSIEIKLNKLVDIINMYRVHKTCKKIINSDESSKFYRLDIFSPEKINLKDKYTLKQKTPLRVLHRRANMERVKEIEVLKSLEYQDETGFYYEIEIKASSGAYIKEWVNGDFERTVPNLNSDLLNLDVIRVDKSLDKSEIIHPISLIKEFVE